MTPREALKLTGKAIEGALAFTGIDRHAEGVALVRERFFANARMLKHLPGLEINLWGDFCDSVHTLTARMDESEKRSAWDRVTEDAEGSALLAQYVRDAHEEPLRRRQEMLRRAAAALFDLDLTLDQLSRVHRALRMLSPSDVLMLYWLWLIPEQLGSSAQPDQRMEYWKNTEAEALESSGAIQLRSSSGFGVGGMTRLGISRTGMLILRALRTFVWEHPVPTDIPGHEPRPGARPSDAANALLSGYSDALQILCAHGNQDFDGSVHFDGITQASPPANGKATLVFYRMKTGDGDGIRSLLGQFRKADRNEPVDVVWVDRVEPGPPAYPGTEHVFVAGPHDVMRVLAYGLNALWTS